MSANFNFSEPAVSKCSSADPSVEGKLFRGRYSDDDQVIKSSVPFDFETDVEFLRVSARVLRWFPDALGWTVRENDSEVFVLYDVSDGVGDFEESSNDGNWYTCIFGEENFICSIFDRQMEFFFNFYLETQLSYVNECAKRAACSSMDALGYTLLWNFIKNILLEQRRTSVIIMH